MAKRIPLPDRFHKISKHRQFLYGFAALWIMFYHMGTRVPGGGIWTPLWFFQSTGAGGVEVFLLLTGMGLYASMKKDPRLGFFYGKRFMRVFLPAFIVMAVFKVGESQRLVGYLGSITFLGHWLGAGTVWYVAFILTMYLVYPLIFAVTNRNRKVLYGGVILFIALTFVLESLPRMPKSEILRMVSRIPIFLAGCALAPLFDQDRYLPKWVLPCGILVTVPLMWLFKHLAEIGYLYSSRALAYFAYAIVLVIVVSMIAELLSRGKLGCLVYRFFAYCGQISLEIYLLFRGLGGVLGKLPGFSVHSCGGLKLDIATAICTLILAVVLQETVRNIIKMFGNVRIPAPEED